MARVLTPEQATALVGSRRQDHLEPTVTLPPGVPAVRLVDGDTGELVALLAGLDPTHRRALRGVARNADYSSSVGRHRMSDRGVTFGYAPRKAIALQEGCRLTRLGREQPHLHGTLVAGAGHLAHLFARHAPDQATHDTGYMAGHVLGDWRLAAGPWTSGVINRLNHLPYHRDGNNLPVWSAMPTFRYGMAGGHLHVPEYELVLPCGDGEAVFFAGRQLVHGVTPMRARRDGAYRYSLVFYALAGMTDCATAAEEAAEALRRRTARERRTADRLREDRP